ncbi:hypothetical protein [Nonomuraea sp. B19D2]|uniref:hypothetical protein n=1 Tax=Nonomuraea sp. B19D2 TaxID=3159561 RepID=UPI0032D9F177
MIMVEVYAFTAANRKLIVMDDPTPRQYVDACVTSGRDRAAAGLKAMATGDLGKTLIAAIGLRLGGEDAGHELRRLADEQVPAAAVMTRVQARQLARHVKAALLHLRAAEDIARRAGVDLLADPWENEPARVLLGASEAVDAADTWAIRNAAANGCGEETWRVQRWCSQPDGALPQV